MRIILVRHGRTASNTKNLLDTAAPGADLDDVGRHQAEELIGRLAGVDVAAVYASTLVRAQQTVAPLAASRGLALGVLDGLREIGAGDDEMSPDADRYLRTLTTWKDDLSARVPGGEDGHEFFARFDAAIAAVTRTGDGSLAASHGAALRVWGSHRVRGFDEALGQWGGLANTAVIAIDGTPEDGWTLANVDGVDTYHWSPAAWAGDG